jgi:PAS domain S-box-containing protein
VEAGLVIAVRRVEDAQALRAALDQRLPDAILADWTLPHYCGQSAFVFAHERCPEVPFIFVSGTIPEAAAFEALRQGATDYVLKHQLPQVGPVLLRALDEVEAQRSLRESLAFNCTVLDSVSAEIAVLDRDGIILAVNQPWHRFGLENGIAPGKETAGTGVGADYLAVCLTSIDGGLDDDAVKIGNGIRAVLEGRLTGFHLEYPCHSPQQQRWFSMSVTPLSRNDGGAVVAHTDITERKQAEEKVQLVASVFTHAWEGIMITAADGTIIDVNEAFVRITSYRRDELLGRNPRLLSSGRQDQAFYAAMWDALIECGQWSGEIWNRRKNGEVYAVMQTISAVPDAQGNTRQYVALLSDITLLKEHERQLEHIAHYDTLTRLPNRVLLSDRLHQAMVQAQRYERLLPPAAFLPTIEDHPLAVDVGEWVIATALRQMERWQAAGLNIPVSVNIGALQLQQADFVERLGALLAAHPQVSPGDLVIEVLETSALADLARASQVIEACRGIGVRCALDDFGTGYASLTYLKRLPVIQIKIDQSFVRDMLENSGDSLLNSRTKETPDNA